MRNPDASSTSSSDAWRVALALLLPCIAVIAAYVWAMYANRDALVKLGRGNRAANDGVLQKLERAAARPARFERIALFGDSLTVCAQPDVERAETLGSNLRRQLVAAGTTVGLVDLTHAGLVPLHFFALLDEVLALDVRLVVIEVNLRKFIDPLARPAEERLPGALRKLELLRSMKVLSSLEPEGVTLFDPPLMRLKEHLGLLYVLEGAREGGIASLQSLGEELRSTLRLARRKGASLTEIARRATLSYAVDYTASHNADVLRAMVEELRAARVPFILFVAPIDPAALRAEAGSDALTVRRGIDELQRHVGAEPAEWLDLHDALPTSMFRDYDNHLMVSGCARVARPIAQRVLHVLSRHPRPSPVVAAEREIDG